MLGEIEAAKEEGGGGGKGLIFKLITSLKLICDHPLVYSKSALESIEEEGEGGEEVAMEDDGQINVQKGNESSLARDSGKVMRLLEILRGILDKGEKVSDGLSSFGYHG